MRVLPSLFFASGGLAAALVARTDADLELAMCFAAHTSELAILSNCGSNDALKSCFASIESFSPLHVLECYVKSGCDEQAAMEAHADAAGHCSQLPDTNDSFGDDSETDSNGDLKRRRAILDQAPKPTQAPRFAAAQLLARDPGASLFARASSGDDCMTTKTKQTSSCPIETKNGNEVTGSCFPTEMPVSSCAAGKTCSFDNSGNRICMDLHDTLDVAGIIISIIFGVAIVGSIAAITFLCCRDRKEQKRLTAKAEATALARAATKKKKAEQRTPLMAQREGSVGPAAGRGDPFSDGAHS